MVIQAEILTLATLKCIILRDIDLLHLQGQFGDLGLVATAFGQLVGIVEHIAANKDQHHHEDKADIEVGTGIAEVVEDVFLELDTDLHPDNGGYRHNQPEFDIGLAVFVPLVGADHGLGELMAHVAGHGHRSGHT